MEAVVVQQVHTPVSVLEVCELYLLFTGTWTVIARWEKLQQP